METFSWTGPLSADRPLDHRIAALAARQRGVVSRLQLLALGATPADIAGRVARGSLHRVANAVSAVGHPGIGRGGRTQAALLQLPPTSGVSFDSAARFWEMKGRDPSGLIHVSVAGRGSFAPPAGVKLHFPRNLTREDIVQERGLRVLSPERTVLDLMRTDSTTEITRMLEQLVTTQRRTPDEIHAWAPQASRGMPGRQKLIEALDWVAGPAVIRSEFERLFRSFCQERGLPQPVTNHREAGGNSTPRGSNTASPSSSTAGGSTADDGSFTRIAGKAWRLARPGWSSCG
jgi:hypothetical protein